MSHSRVLGEIRFPRSAAGFCGLAFFDQPALELGLRAALTGEVRLGVAVRGFTQDPAGVTVTLSGRLEGAGGLARRLRRRLSVVRRLAGIPWRGRDLPHSWLVVDAVGDAGRPGFTYTCDPVQPSVDMPLPGGHRWEFLLRKGSPPPPPIGLEVVRSVEYRFAARRAARWRAGRVLLAGDAAHTMPPFAGQGLGAGVRDAWALAALLSRGDPVDYEQLRAPHVREMTRLSLLLGTILQARRGGAARDALLAGAFRTAGLGSWLSTGGPRRPSSGVLDL